MQVPTDKAVSIGVIVTELVTNAWKYAYPDRDTGDIRISCRRDGDELVCLIVEDDGIGIPTSNTPRGTGIGTKIVNAMATNLTGQVRNIADNC